MRFLLLQIGLVSFIFTRLLRNGFSSIIQSITIPQYISSFLPIMGPLHVSLNARELVFLKNSFLFNDIYKGMFGVRKILGKKPQPWRIDLILHIVRMAWFDIVDTVYLKFGYMCKNIEFLYITD